MKSQFGVLFTKTYDILPDYYGISDLGLPLPHFEFLEPVFNEDFDQIYLNTGSKTQNVGKLSQDLIFYNGKLSKVLVKRAPS